MRELKFYIGALLFALIFAAYSNVLFAPFVFDDHHFVEASPQVTMQAPISLHAARAVTLTTYRLNYLFGESNTFGYHLVNVLIHAVNAGLVFALLNGLLRPVPNSAGLPNRTEIPLSTREAPRALVAQDRSDKDSSTLAAFLAAGIFALHPLQSEAVTYISGRPELLMTLFTLLALYGCRHWRLICALCALLAIMSKESGIVVIPLVLGYLSSERGLSRRVLVGVGGIGAALAAYLYSNAHFAPSGRSFIEHALLQSAQLWHYLTMLVYPVGLSIDHDPAQFSVTLRVLSLAGTIAAVAVCAKCDRRCRLLVAFIAISLAPRFLINIPETLAEHHMYLPMVAISGLLALGIEHLFSRTKESSHGSDIPEAAC